MPHAFLKLFFIGRRPLMRKNTQPKRNPPKPVPPEPHFSPRSRDYGLAFHGERHNPSSGFTYSQAEDFRSDRSVNPNVRYVPDENSRDELREWDDYDPQSFRSVRIQPSRQFSPRSDDDVFDFVHEILSKHPDIDVSQIDMDVHDGVVHLQGMVETRRMKRLIEDVIFGLPGVHDVQNKIEVERPDPDRRRMARSLT